MSVATEIEFEATDFSSETPKHEAENLAEGARHRLARAAGAVGPKAPRRSRYARAAA